MIYAVLNQKGGVGKTTVTVNLGEALAQLGHRVLCIDLDAQHNTTSLLGHKEPDRSIFDVLVGERAIEDILIETSHSGVHLLPANRRLATLDTALSGEIGRELILRTALESINQNYDIILIDNGPALGLASVMSLCAADIALVPLQCEPLALQGLSQVQDTISKIKKLRLNPRLQMRIVISLLDAARAGDRSIRDTVRQRLGDTVCRTEIRRYAVVSSSAWRGGTVLASSPKSAAALSFQELAQELNPKIN